MHQVAPPGAFQPASRAHFASQASLAPMDAPSGSKLGPQASPHSYSYIEIHDDDDDDDELPPIPADWATPIIATHCQPPAQPQSATPATPVCAPSTTTFHRPSLQSTEDNTRDFNWLTDIFANRRYDVRWNFNLCPERETDFRRRRDIAFALMATRAIHFETFRLEVVDEGFPTPFCCGGPLYDYEVETTDGLEPVDEAEAERQWSLEELALADEEAEADETASYYRSDMSDEASSYEESLHTPTDESPMQDQDAPFSAESLKVELKQAIKALDRQLHNVYANAHIQTANDASSCQSITTQRHDQESKYGATASLAATLYPRTDLHPQRTHRPTSQSTSSSRIDVEAVAMGVLTWPAQLVTYAVSSLVPSHNLSI